MVAISLIRQSLPYLSTTCSMQLLEGLPDHVKLVEVGPRDGLQNEKELVSLSHSACTPNDEGQLLNGLRLVQDTGLYAAQSNAGRHSSQESAASQRSSFSRSHTASTLSIWELCLFLGISRHAQQQKQVSYVITSIATSQPRLD